MSILDPKRGDMIATMGETTVPNSLLKHIYQRMGRDVSGAELLRWKPRINEGIIDRNWLATLPDGTLGKEYLRFLFYLQVEVRV
jgi:ubiquinone biosynthesis protein COQ4